ncbi:MAG: HAMP domain-containing sensor histidine kinase [Elusimicrobiota bacterium]|nr:HAMP domain-containing sensor histidine kinase [Elusimicrobiota bacterium]
MKLRQRHALSIFAVGLFCGAALVADRAASTRRLLSERAQARAEAIAAAVARGVQEPAGAGDADAVASRLKLFADLSGVERVQILDARGRARFTATHRYGRPPEGALRRAASEHFAGAGDEPLSVSVAVWTDASEGALWPTVVRGAAWTLLSVATLALVSWWLGRLAGRKIEQLVDAVNRAPGDFSRHLPDLTMNSEIGALSRAYRDLQRRLKEEHDRRLKLEAARDDMTAMLVHDLKHPLTVFRLAMSLLTDAVSAAREPDIASALSLAGRSSSRMESMIDGVLQVARVEQGDEPPDRVRVPVLEFLDDCAQEDSLIVGANGRPWRLERDLSLHGGCILAHPAMLRRLVGNLVLNAIDHSPDGTEVVLGARAAHDDPLSVVIYVLNDASRLDSDPESLLQGRFQGEGGPSHAGLGLAFCRFAARWHSGRLDAKRLDDGRVEFSVRMPLGRSEGAPGRETREEQAHEIA